MPDRHTTPDYAKIDYKWLSHHARFERRVANGLCCQECGGAGGWVEVVLHETGQGPWEMCGWCEGTGKITPWLRGQWLKYKRHKYA